MRRRADVLWAVLLFTLVSVVTRNWAVHRKGPAPTPSSCSPESPDSRLFDAHDIQQAAHLLETASYGRYTVKDFAPTSEPGRFEIWQGGRLLYLKSGFRFHIGNFRRDGSDQPDHPLPGEDVTGLGRPDLVISEHQGGHGGSRVRVFELEPRFRELVSAYRAPILGQFDRAFDGKPILIGYEETFICWWSDCASSQYPRIIQSYQRGRFRLDLPRMRAKRSADWKAMRRAVLSESWDKGALGCPPPARYWGRLLDLIYTGDVPAARRLSQAAWAPHVPGGEAFLRSFLEQLRKSPFYTDLNVLHAGQLEAWRRAANPSSR